MNALRLLLLLTCLAPLCRLAAEEKPAFVPPTDAKSAIALFQIQAKQALPEQLPAEWRKVVEKQIADTKHLHARKMKCAKCHYRIDNTLSAEERQRLILLGDIGELARQKGECWEIMSFGGFGSGIEAYLDAKTGRMLMFWIVPEG